MIVYALVGKSGSGKSHRAQHISKLYGIECIIDDGLLINGNKVVAGVSAKKEETKIGAIKRAIFSDESHRREVADAIRDLNPVNILLLGTSDDMVDRIVQNLDLPPISKRVHIEEIATPREIETAIKMRREQGKHVIPVPTFAIKKDFSGYFIDSIKSLGRKDKATESDYIEKTVVRPTFSYLGKYTINDGVIKSMISFAGSRVDGVHKVLKVNIGNMGESIKIDMEISVDLGYIIYDVANRLRRYVKDEVEYITAFNVLEVNVLVKSLNLD